MSADTVIQWAHDSVNFWWGCARVSPGCRKCYAAGIAARLSRGRATWGQHGLRWLRYEEALATLARLEARAERSGERRRVFVNSMADTFEDRPDLDCARAVLFSAAAFVPHLDLLLLTKRPQNVRRLVPAPWLNGEWPANVWLGVTGENQQEAENRLRELYLLPAPVRFLSAEPLLGPLDLNRMTTDPRDSGFACTDGWGRFDGETAPLLDWVIAGGESGAGATPCDLDWLRSLRDQCVAARVPFFLKQLGRRPVDTVTLGDGRRSLELLRLRDSHGGDPVEWPADLRVRQLPDSQRSTLSSQRFPAP